MVKPSRSAKVRSNGARPSSSAKSKSPRRAASVAAVLVPATGEPAGEVVIQGRPFTVELETTDAIAVGELLAMSMNLPDPSAIEKFRKRYPQKNTTLVTPIVPTDEELRTARELVSLVGVALSYGTRDSWDRIRRAYVILREIESTNDRIAACVHLIADAVEAWHRAGGFHDRGCEAVKNDLAFYEPAFRALTVAEVRQALQGAKSRRATIKGGRTNVGALYTAAELTLSVGAFGQEHKPEETYEQALRRIKTALNNGTKRSGKAR